MLRGTGRTVEHDPESKKHPAPSATVRSKRWVNNGPRLDQLESRACEGFALTAVLNSDPLHTRSQRYLGAASALGLYGWATRLDEFRGNTYPGKDLGTSNLGIAKAGVQMGFFDQYVWGFGFDHSLEASMSGPCVVGANWYSDMSRPQGGYARIGGRLVGGHAWELLGVDLEHEYVVGQNSWGSEWGLGGRFRLPFPDFRRLLEEDGDVMLPIRSASGTIGR